MDIDSEICGEIKKPNVSFLIPAYNEAKSIVKTIACLSDVMKQYESDYEILVIDDGSSDDTAQLARDQGVSVISHPANGGYGKALKTGLSIAKYDWCAIVDADGTYPLDKFPDLMRYIPAFSMVVGARTGAHYWGSLRKRIGRYILLQLIQYVVGVDIPDVNSGMRIFKKDIALKHIQRISSGFSFTTTLTLAMLMDGHFVKYIPISYQARLGKSKVHMIRDTLRMSQILTRAIMRYNPIKLYIPLCAFGLLIGLSVSLVSFFIPDKFIPGLLFFGVSALVSILIMALGLAAEITQT
jgi:glycosyltransferase involved in cell wall biosynthesis